MKTVYWDVLKNGSVESAQSLHIRHEAHPVLRSNLTSTGCQSMFTDFQCENITNISHEQQSPPRESSRELKGRPRAEFLCPVRKLPKIPNAPKEKSSLNTLFSSCDQEREACLIPIFGANSRADLTLKPASQQVCVLNFMD